MRRPSVRPVLAAGLAALLAATAVIVVPLADPAVAAPPPYKTATVQEVATTTFLRMLLLQDPTAPPPGVNDWSCVPSAAHPEPIVLVHGTGGNRYTNWAYVGPRLANEGYCVFALNYGGIAPTAVFQGSDAFTPEIPGIRPSGLDASAAQIVKFIDQVRAATGAAKVDLVGHSQGALLALYVPKLTDSAPKIRRVVTLGSPTQGSTVNGLTVFGEAFGFTKLLKLFYALGCEMCGDAPIPGGIIIERLHDGGIAIPGIAYTNITTRFDQLVTPAEQAFIPIDQQVPEAQAEISNILVQDVCPASRVGHVGLAYDTMVFQMIDNGLDPSTASPVVCGPHGPPF